MKAFPRGTRFFVRWSDDGETEEYPSVKEAVDAILGAFASTGANPVDEVWAEDPNGDEHALGVRWKVELEAT